MNWANIVTLIGVLACAITQTILLCSRRRG